MKSSTFGLGPKVLRYESGFNQGKMKTEDL